MRSDNTFKELQQKAELIAKKKKITYKLKKIRLLKEEKKLIILTLIITLLN